MHGEGVWCRGVLYRVPAAAAGAAAGTDVWAGLAVAGACGAGVAVGGASGARAQATTSATKIALKPFINRIFEITRQTSQRTESVALSLLTAHARYSRCPSACF